MEKCWKVIFDLHFDIRSLNIVLKWWYRWLETYLWDFKLHSLASTKVWGFNKCASVEISGSFFISFSISLCCVSRIFQFQSDWVNLVSADLYSVLGILPLKRILNNGIRFNQCYTILFPSFMHNIWICLNQTTNI